MRGPLQVAGPWEGSQGPGHAHRPRGSEGPQGCSPAAEWGPSGREAAALGAWLAGRLAEVLVLRDTLVKKGTQKPSALPLGEFIHISTVCYFN